MGDYRAGLQAMTLFVPMPEDDVRVNITQKMKEEIKKGSFK